MIPRLTLHAFIERACTRHNNKYTYGDVVYKNMHTKVVISCPIHGVFLQTPDSHLRGNGCPACTGSIPHTTESFIQTASIVHKSKYTYDKAIYGASNKEKITITCPIHGDFQQEASSHLCGHGCPYCAGHDQKDTAYFVNKAILVHGDKYDYSKATYVKASLPVEIVCKEHGSFLQPPNSHLAGHGCAKCYWSRSGDVKRHTTDLFVSIAKEIHGNTYDYSNSVYSCSQDKVEIVCPVHGSFWQAPAKHIYGQGCPTCKASTGALSVKKCLFTKKIVHSLEYKFNDCADVNPLPFDFAVYTDASKNILKCLIEFDGRQHYEAIEFFGGEKALLLTQLHDAIKNQYCEDNGIKLIRIPYWDIEKIPEILDREIE